MVGTQVRGQCAGRQRDQKGAQLLHQLFDHIVAILADKIEGIKTEDGKAISFFTEGRDSLTINVTRKDLRTCVHPKAGACFDPKAKFGVERFRFWDGSCHKASGKYGAMSIWISEKKYLPGVKEIIDFPPKTV